jgi:hypothetical protein
MSSKTIILSTIGMLLVGFIFLSLTELKQADINSKNIWFLYFTDPKSDSLDFTIENHSKNENFHWQILIDKTVAVENNSVVSSGDKKTLSVPKDNVDLSNKKVTISVTDGSNNTKEIYKNF